jgi:hypothetical protein
VCAWMRPRRAGLLVLSVQETPNGIILLSADLLPDYFGASRLTSLLSGS